MSYFKSKTATEEVNIFYEDFGKGPPVILIHGWPLSHRMWEYQLEEIVNAGFRCITYDRRGFGESDKPWRKYDYDTLASDLNNLIHHLSLTDSIIVGFSMGGGEVARFIGNYGTNKISKAALIAAVPPFMLKTSDNPEGLEKEVDICNNNIDNLQNNSDAMFSTQSIDEMIAHTVNGGGNVCAATTSNGNAAPNVNAGTDYTIPARTPFEMTGSATDADFDTLTYSWEQFDLGPAQAVNAGDNGSSPLFRVFPPSVTPTRTFPQLDSILNNTTIVGETLPTTTRSLTLRLTVRDQMGGIDKDTALLSVEDTGQGFEFTSQNSATTLPPGGSVDITWNVAGTTDTPISCASVDVLMSVDGGQSFSTTLASSVPNDGSQSVTLPNNPETQVRFKVKCSNNIFFDINNADVVIGVVPVILTYEDVPTTPMVIDDASASCSGTPITRTINVSDALTVNDMMFGFTADHSYRGDIQVIITSPNLSTATVIATNSGDGDDNYDVSLDDSQTLPLDNDANDNTASPFYDRGAAPSSALSVFNGENASGDWLISMCDAFSVDDGLYYRSALKFPVADFDGDGDPDLSDPDDDDDGVLDTADSCLTADYNISADNDSDGCDDADEDKDDDNDGMQDEWENFYGLDPLLDFDAQLDGDNDQLTNLDEFTQGTDPTKPNVNIADIQNELVKRAEIAKRILLKVYGLGYIPPAATGAVYTDVQAADFNARWIEKLAADGNTEGCATNHFCPDMIVTKGQLSKLLLKSVFGSAFTPTTATGVYFTDVTPSTFSADWIEELLNQEFTEGCDADNFCPNEAVTVEGFNTMLNKVFP